MRAGRLFSPERGSLYSPFGRGGLEVSDGWCNAPPISSEEITLCSVPSSSPHKIYDFAGPLFCEKRECAVHGGREKTGARKACLRFYACLLPAAQCKRGFGCCRIDSLLFSLPLTWRLQGWSAYRFLSVGHSVGAAAPGGPFLQTHPSTDRPSRGRALSRPAPLGQPLF